VPVEGQLSEDDLDSGEAPTTPSGRSPENAADLRDVEARRNDELADRRDESRDRRDQAGQRKDSSADRRSQALDLLDDAADLADNAASERDRVASSSSRVGPLDRQTAEEAAAVRQHGRLDRERAASDRHASAAERASARLDRSASSSDRADAHRDRSLSSTDRDNAQLSRDYAVVDRGVAMFDDLTGAYRRGAGLAELEREIARSVRTDEPLVLAFIDLDGLKAVNDSLGHAAGDRLLVAVVETLAARLRSYDVIVRVGGDEFVCFCQGLTIAALDTRLALANAELALEGRSMSIGLAELQAHDTSATFIARADQALYRDRARRRSPG
jgi:diguanylate cyclase (GGDEF)-like protein